MNNTWHTLSKEETLQKLSSTRQGLSESAVHERQEKYGKNLLPKGKSPGLLAIFLHQFKSPLIYVLLIAGIIAMAMDDYTDAIFIFGVILLNAVIGTFQEWKSEKSALELQNLMKTRAQVRRNGTEEELDAEELVPGDIVILSSGAKIPADIRLVHTKSLSVDESLLTGESTAIEKQTDPLPTADIPPGDRSNIAFAGSSVLSGRAEGVVIATASDTELGAIADAVSGALAAKPPLLIRMERFVGQISVITLGAIFVLGGVSLAQGMSFTDVLFMAVALAVAAIPEGLPVAMTIALSLGVTRMAKRNVIVRRLPAVEGLGSCTYIASDKTGTLTQNRQMVRVVALANEKGEFERIDVPEFSSDQNQLDEDPRLTRLAKSAALASEGHLTRHENGWRRHGDAIDVGFLELAHQTGLEPSQLRKEHPTFAEIPYESERKYGAHIFHNGAEKTLELAIKGAPEAILPRCHSLRTAASAIAVEPETLLGEAERLAADGFRVLALARSSEINRSDFDGAQFSDEKLPPLELLGFVGFIDPLRPEAKNAVEECKKAGVQVGMITGDHPATALAIARNLGIAFERSEVVTGKELEELGKKDSASFRKKVASSHVFARVSPVQKLEIVDALMASGHFVAVTGDGVNDAPALRRANIGVAMGSGTDVAKETASIIIANDNFATIEAGIEEGRFAYANLRKVIYLLISGGAGEILLFALALAAGLPLPLLPAQLIWVNLVTNGIQDVALAFEKGEHGVMRQAPRNPTEPIFDRMLVQETILTGLVIGIGTFAAWAWLLANGYSEFHARNLTLLLLVLFLNFHAMNCRSELQSVFRVPLSNNRVLIAGIATALGLHLASMHIPIMQSALRVEPVSFTEILMVALTASSILFVSELFKWIKRRKSGNALVSEKSAASQPEAHPAPLVSPGLRQNLEAPHPPSRLRHSPGKRQSGARHKP